jgi:hypothetical protein
MTKTVKIPDDYPGYRQDLVEKIETEVERLTASAERWEAEALREAQNVILWRERCEKLQAEVEKLKSKG